MCKVAVLMSSYNGERYIKEQIESILNQEFIGEIFLIIRDDGSTDSTCNIIESFSFLDSRIKLIKGENIGYVSSFFLLLR